MKLILSILIMSISTLLAEPAKSAGFTHVRAVGGIDEYTLDSNGMRVLLMPQKSVPVVTFMVTYHVGSRHEVTGTTGATHLLEHLMFKGTERFNRSKGTGFDQLLERVGAETNATTWLDRTNYYATVPSNALPLLVELEADRMRNLTLSDEDRKPEMTVVRNEFERGENDPRSALDKEMWAAAFMAHPYHHDTIGWRSDIERVPIEKLRAFYDTFYWPNNATATVIGDFEQEKALALIREKYGVIPKAPHPFPEIYTEEPEQTAQRRVGIRRAGELGVVSIAHKIPRATDPDWPATQVLSAVLTRGKTSRLYRALTDKNLTIDASAFCAFNYYPTLHTIYAELASGAKHADVEKRIFDEIAAVQKKGVTQAEVRNAVAGLLAERAFERDGTFALASMINECIAVGDWALFSTLDAKLRAVSPSDVQRVAKKYFVTKRSVAGWYEPEADEPDDATPAAAAPQKDEHFKQKEVLPPKPPEKELDAPSPTRLAAEVVREKIEGVDVLVCRTPAKDIITIRGSLTAGETSAKNRAIANLAAGMLERGTTKRDEFAIAELLENAGAQIEYSAGNDTLEFTAKCLSGDVSLVIELLAEQLRQPAFGKAEFEKLKKQFSSELQMTLEDTNAQAGVAFSRALFPEGHPNRKQSIATLITEIETAKLPDVREFHQQQFGAAGMRLVATGDVDAAVVRQLVAKHFAGWNTAPTQRAAFEKAQPKGGEKIVQMPDKTSVSVIIGQPSGLRSSDANWLPLRLATDVLGKGFTSRLLGNIRDREGLTYGIGASTSGDVFSDGAWHVKATFSPTLLEKGIASTLREISAWHKDGINADELAYRKSAVAGQFAVEMETTEGLAEQLLRCVERDFPISWLDEFPSKLRALTLEQVNAAIRQNLDPSKMVIIKVGTVQQDAR